MGEEPDQKEWQQGEAENSGKTKVVNPQFPQKNFIRRLIQGPVLITAAQADDLPHPPQLWEYSHAAMTAFAAKDEFEFSQGGWQFIARPVRASDQSCLNCHLQDSTRIIGYQKPDEKEKRLKMGDPLGVILYAYRGPK
jgi:hypothetical protein